MNAHSVKKSFSIKQALKAGIDFFRSNWFGIIVKSMSILFVALLGIAIIYVGFLSLFFLKYDHIKYRHIWVAGLLPLQIIVLVAWFLGFNRCLLEIHDTGKAHIRTLFSTFRLFQKYLRANMLYNALVALGNFLLVIPGLILSTMYYFVDVILIDNEQSGVWAAFRRSNKLIRGVGVKLFFFCLLFIPIIILLQVLFFLMQQSVLWFFYTILLGDFTPFIMSGPKMVEMVVCVLISLFFALIFYSVIRLMFMHIYRTLERFEEHKESQEVVDQKPVSEG